MFCHLRACSTVTIPLCPGLAPKRSAATPKGPCAGGLCERKLWAPGVGCHGRRASPVLAATGVQAAQSVTHLQTHGACSSESDTANYVQSSSAKVSFFFSFCNPSKPKAFCTPQASTFNCFTPINAINKSSPVPCCRVLPPKPCRAAEPPRSGKAVTRFPRRARNPASPGSGVGGGIALHLPATPSLRTTPTAGPHQFN